MRARRVPQVPSPQDHRRLIPLVFAIGTALGSSGSTLWAQQPAPLTPLQAGPTLAAPAPAKIEPGGPIAIVPVATTANVIGASRITLGKAFITSNGSVTSGSKSTEVLLPRRGTLRICASTTVLFATDNSVPASGTPGLMLALDHGAVETSFATGRNSDVLLTPDFRILIGGGGSSSEVKVRLGEHGDTCVDNPGTDAPYVVVSSVFDGGAYRVQSGQRVMFQHGSLSAVVDQEKEPCGCPAEARPNTNDFPLAQSAGLAPLAKPAPGVPATPAGPDGKITEPLVYAPPSPPGDAAAPAPADAAQPATAPPPATAQAKHGQKFNLFHSIGRFLRRLFGAE